MLLGIFLAFYVQALSTTWMTRLITIVLGQLYEVLRDYTKAPAVDRLAETAAGAAAGIFVTYAVLPVASRDTLGAWLAGNCSRRWPTSSSALGGRSGAAVLHRARDDLSRGSSPSTKQPGNSRAPMTR